MSDTSTIIGGKNPATISTGKINNDVAIGGLTFDNGSLPVPTASTNKIVSGSSNIRQNNSITTSKANDLTKNLADHTPATVVIPPSPNTTPTPGSYTDQQVTDALTKAGTNYARQGDYIIDKNTSQIVSSLADFMGGKTVLGGNANNGSAVPGATAGNLPAPVDYASSPAGQAKQAEIDTAQKQLTDAVQNGTLTAGQQADLQNTINGLTGQYDNLIAQAEQQKAQGMASATVQAGEKGGFLNTQYSGQAAVTPTPGANFVGAGGELEQVKSAYDMNITQLKNEESVAIAQATAAAKQAAQTGDQNLLAVAQQSYDRANTAAQNLYAAQTKYTQDTQTLQNNQLTYATNLANSLAPSLVSLDANGKVTPPTQQQIQSLIQQYPGIDPKILQGAINNATANYVQTGAAVTKSQLGSGTMAEYNTWKTQQEAAGLPSSVQDFMGAKATAAKGGASMAPDTVSYFAQLVEGGNMDILTKLGMGGIAAKLQIMNQVAQDAMTGKAPIDLNTQTALYKSYTGALNQVQKQYEAVKPVENKVNSQLGIVSDLAGKIDNSGTPAFNRWLNAGKVSIAGDADVSNLNNAMNQLSYELGQLLSNSSGSGAATVSGIQDAQSRLNSAMSPDQISGAINLMKREIANVDPAFEDAINNTTQSITMLNPGSSSSGETSSGGGTLVDAANATW